MFLVYVDESGDTGLVNSPSNYFCLSAIVVHESHWQTTLNSVIGFRKELRAAMVLNYEKKFTVLILFTNLVIFREFLSLYGSGCYEMLLIFKQVYLIIKL